MAIKAGKEIPKVKSQIPKGKEVGEWRS